MKHILVTGATDGIGLATARALFRAGHHVLVHGRDAGRAESACAVIAESGGAGSATPVWADFADLVQVAALAGQVIAAAPTLNVLINNAGVYVRQRAESVDGIELTLAVNHYAPFALTALLLPLLDAGPGNRVVNVSSMTHADGKLDFSDLDMQRSYTAYAAYARSKLCNILFTKALARRLEQSTAFALHPGVVGTKLLRAGFNMRGASTDDGARTSVYLALDPGVARLNGAYVVDCKPREASRTARDAALAEALWQHSNQRLAGLLPAWRSDFVPV